MFVPTTAVRLGLGLFRVVNGMFPEAPMQAYHRAFVVGAAGSARDPTPPAVPLLPVPTAGLVSKLVAC